MDLNAFLGNLHQPADCKFTTSIVGLDSDIEGAECDEEKLRFYIGALLEEEARTGSAYCLVGTSRMEADSCDCAAGDWLADGVYAILSIHFTSNSSDSSAGVEHLPKPGDFETRPAASRLADFMAASGGLLTIQSAGGNNVTWRLYLRATSRPTENFEFDEALSYETVLLVEDEAFVRSVTREVLELSGYCVLEARNAQEGMEMFKKNPCRVDLLLTDVVMPGMNGPELVRKLMELAPGLRVVFMSGYGDQRVAHLHAENVSRQLRAFKDKVGC